MSKMQKILQYLVILQRRKESTEMKEHEQKTDSSKPTGSTSKPTGSTSAFQSNEFDSAEERINLDKPNIASDDIAKILLPNRSNNVDKLHLLKYAFRPVGEAAMALILKNVALLKDNDFVISTKIISEHIHGWYIQKVTKSFIANTVLYFLRLY